MFEPGKLYDRRRDIHAKYADQQQGGIATPRDKPYIFLFTGESGEQYGYKDGWGVFWGADTLTVMELTKKEGAPVPAFNPFIYSLEVFVPLVDLHQERYYLPNTEGTCDAWSCVAWFRAYFWLHIALGWVSSTLLVAALTGLVRKE